MLAALVGKLKNQSDLQSFFYYGEIALVCLFGVVIFLFRSKTEESNFKVTEAELKARRPKSFGKPFGGGLRSNPNGQNSDALAQARIPRVQKPEPLRLTGIRIDGAPHEILGVLPQATPTQIQQAYRELMKRYHPDKVGPQGSREWKEAQNIAFAINRAKDEMLKKK